MDEVGRGTGTLDGVSIAWAVSDILQVESAVEHSLQRIIMTYNHGDSWYPKHENGSNRTGW